MHMSFPSATPNRAKRWGDSSIEAFVWPVKQRICVETGQRAYNGVSMTDGELDSVIEAFAQRYRALAGVPHVVANAEEAGTTIRRILAEAGAESVVMAGLPDDLAATIAHSLADSGIACDVGPFPANDLPGRIDRAAAGITNATFAIAQSGTLVEVATNDVVRLVSGLPRTHIGIVRSRDIVPRFDDAAPRLRQIFDAHGEGCTVSFISGPSRTGDIELKLTLGVHGPEFAHAIVIAELGA